jgi:hypothetical protein
MKKDHTYVAAVERAIAEKYGKKAVQDFRSQWEEEDEKEYLSQLAERNHRHKNHHHKQKVETENYSISKRPSTKKSLRTCPICKTYSFSYRDDLYMSRFKSCFLCYVDFIEFREEEWENGWRPNLEELSNAMRRRKNNV